MRATKRKCSRGYQRKRSVLEGLASEEGSRSLDRLVSRGISRFKGRLCGGKRREREREEGEKKKEAMIGGDVKSGAVRNRREPHQRGNK